MYDRGLSVQPEVPSMLVDRALRGRARKALLASPEMETYLRILYLSKRGQAEVPERL
jgi:hypothetical protein